MNKRRSEIEIPAFMRSDIGKGAEFSLEDMGWIGEEELRGEADVKREKLFSALSEQIYGPHYILRLILVEIIKSHPTKDRIFTDGARLEQAFRALLPDLDHPAILPPAHVSSLKEVKKQSTDKQHGGGPKEVIDDGVLRIMAREYFKDFYGISNIKRAYKELCDEALSEEFPKYFELRTTYQLNNDRRRIIRKFRQNLDKIMIEYASRSGAYQRYCIQVVNEILLLLAKFDLVAHRSVTTTIPVKVSEP